AGQVVPLALGEPALRGPDEVVQGEEVAHASLISGAAGRSAKIARCSDRESGRGARARPARSAATRRAPAPRAATRRVPAPGAATRLPPPAQSGAWRAFDGSRHSRWRSS